MIGVFGGTFDPIHFGHLRPALDILDELELDQMRFIPCGEPAHRPSPKLDGATRFAMVVAAIAVEPSFVADDREIRREGPSYMVDTLGSLKKELTGQTLCLVLGRDAFFHLPGWHQWKTIFDLAHVVVMSRPQRNVPTAVNPALQHILEQRQVDTPMRLQQQENGLVYFCDVTQLDISATKIRAMVSQGKNPAFLLPQKVLDIIQRQNLYCDGPD